MTLPFPPTPPRRRPSADDYRPQELIRREPRDATAVAALEALLADQERRRQAYANQGTMGVPSGLRAPSLLTEGLGLAADIATPGPVGAGTGLRSLYDMATGDFEKGAKALGAEFAIGMTTSGIGSKIAKARKLKSLVEMAGEGGEAAAKVAPKSFRAFHATDVDFAVPRAGTMFTTNQRYAADFADMLKSGGRAGRVREAELTLANPADLRALNMSPSDLKPADIERLKKMGYDGAQYRDEAYVIFDPAQARMLDVAATTAAGERAQRAITTGKGKPRGMEKFGVMTAENMGGEPGKKAANRSALEALDKSLQRRGLASSTVPVTGAYTDETSGKTLKELGRMIVGATPYEMETLGRQFRQNSVLTDKGLHDLASGNVVPSRGTLRAETLPAGAPYTQLPTGERISLDLNWNQNKPLQDAAKQLGKYVPPPVQGPSAPFVLLPPNSGTVLNEENLGRMVPELASMERAPTRYPNKPDWSLIDPVTARFRSEYTPAVLRGIKENPRSLGWYDTTELAKLFQDYAPEGLDDFRLAMRLTSPPSAGTRVFPENLRMGSWAYEQAKKGLLTPEALQGKKLSIPKGYKHRFQKGVNKGWERILSEGKLDPFEQPKTYRHAEVPALGSWWNVALDRHLGRTVGEEGLLFNKKTGEYDIPGVGFPEPSYATTRQIDTSPSNTHYSMIEDGLLDEAARLGLAPPQYMAAGWVGNAKKTNVDDTRTLVELYNEMFRRTGEKRGISPLEAAKGWAAGGLPLWALLGMAGGASAAGQQQGKTSPSETRER